MKKLILVAAITMSTLLHAQDTTPDKKLSFGIKAGVNFANNTGNAVRHLLYNEASSANSRIGVIGGAFMEYKLSEKFAIQPEVLYSQQGFQKKFSDDDYEVKLKLGYINIPLMAKYYVTDGLSLEIGPQIGFLTSAKHFEKDLDDDEEYNEDIKELFKSTDFGLNFGAGYQLENGLGINARYTLGLTDIYDFYYIGLKPNTKSIGEENSFELKNRVFNISVFYTF